MSQRLSDYLARESSEYLGELHQALSDPGPVDAERFLRLSRGVRGSVTMAGIDSLARVAEQLEDAAVALHAGDAAWSEGLRRTALATVHDLRELLGALDRWGPAEEERVREAMRRWDLPGAEHADGVVPIAALFFDDAGPHVLSEAEQEEGVVPVETLLLRGPAALQEALRLRRPLEDALQGGAPPAEVRRLVDELFELVELGASGEPEAA